VPSTLAPGAKADLDLFALLNTSVMDITEGEKASAEISLEYKVGDTPYADTRVRTITLYNRNAMTWEDDRRAAAFVTRFDPVVQDYSKNFVAAIDGLGSEAVSRSLLTAIGTHQVLLLTGVKYTVDPASSYAQQVTRKLDVDYLQFPRQTLQRKGGDCDDLSILYCALLESVGISTAFVTVPGHILMAFALDVDPADVGRTFSSTADIFIRDGKAWVPVEVTERKAGFVTAWKTAAQEWRQSAAAGTLGFYPLQEAWKAFAPVQSPGAEAASGILSPPAAADLLRSVKAEIAVFQEGEVAPQVLALRRQIDPRKGNPALQNKIGILYAKYGLLDRAETEFRALTANAKTAFVSAIINMANLYFLREDYSSALRYYSQAAQKEPTPVSAQLGLARSNYALGRYSEAQAAMASVRKSDPQLADRFAFMEAAAAGGARAADVSANKGVAVWDE
jgi:tetratricopeptide (TPR) repeat protein